MRSLYGAGAVVPCAFGPPAATERAISDTSVAATKSLHRFIMALLDQLSRVRQQSGNHSAFEHFIGDGRRYSVDEFSPHLRIVVEQLN
jgi:hypothetical protein